MNRAKAQWNSLLNKRKKITVFRVCAHSNDSRRRQQRREKEDDEQIEERNIDFRKLERTLFAA